MGVKIASSIIFLGTGGDSYVVGKQLRASGGIILQINDDQYHIDPGPGALVMAKETGVNLRANTALFVTHNHLNHCNDINAVIDAMTYGGFD
ncbi:MAG: MBL fold metallo-hydrolase, partial [Candidatus Woesearchaeota archaeon]|nr:MBL fold metallo-hydrolase [Candidatus Woesearchaeota archaeon]